MAPIWEESKRNSDLDILVEFNETIDLFEFIKLENYLTEILGCKVDLVMKDTLKPRIKDRILNEAVSIWNEITGFILMISSKQFLR